MIKDIFDSLRDNISQKTSNPLLATILIVWTFKNWRLLYGLFYFDEDTKLEERIAYIEIYYSEVNFYENLFFSILYAFCVLIITYVLLSASRYIVNFYDKIIIPRVYRLTDKTSVVLKSDYIELLRMNEEIDNKYSTERDSKNRVKAELEVMESNYTELVLKKDSALNSVNELKLRNQTLEEIEQISKSMFKFRGLAKKSESVRKQWVTKLKSLCNLNTRDSLTRNGTL
uniref:hypothetical protein n=1 Tax=Pontibacter pamirensis TaxID=2562824 RepID=UPI00138A1F20